MLSCSADCKYMYYNQYPATITKAAVLTKVHQLVEKKGLTDSQTQQFVKKITSDKNLK